MTLVAFCHAAMLYTELVHGDVTYWKRTEETEAREEHPVLHSPHKVWFGIDVKPHTSHTAAERIEWGRRLFLKVIVEADHDHLQPWDWEAG